MTDELVGRATMWGRATHLGYRDRLTSLCGLKVLKAVVPGGLRNVSCRRCLTAHRSIATPDNPAWAEMTPAEILNHEFGPTEEES